MDSQIYSLRNTEEKGVVGNLCISLESTYSPMKDHTFILCQLRVTIQLQQNVTVKLSH
jgi:hypothetical protein